MNREDREKIGTYFGITTTAILFLVVHILMWREAILFYLEGIIAILMFLAGLIGLAFLFAILSVLLRGICILFLDSFAWLKSKIST